MNFSSEINTNSYRKQYVTSFFFFFYQVVISLSIVNPWIFLLYVYNERKVYSLKNLSESLDGTYQNIMWYIGTQDFGHILILVNFLYLSTIISASILMVWFYGISTIVGYWMPIPVYSYILGLQTIHISKSTKGNSSKFTNNSIKHQTFVYTV